MMTEQSEPKQATRILVVEDERGIAQFIEQGLSEAGYRVDVATNGQHGLDQALTIAYDAIVLDIQLPEVDGLRLLRTVREQGDRTPVLLLTARDGVDDRVVGLDTGADDYLVKPFAFPELLARLRALLRRPPIQHDLMLRVGDLVLDTTRYWARRGERRIDLSAREWTLLEYLMRHTNQVLTRTQIAEHVWALDFYTESNVVDVYIGYLRRKVDLPGSPPLIQTVRGIGYRIGTDIDA